MKKTTKKENLFNYVKEACIVRIKEDYGIEYKELTKKEVKAFVNAVFYSEKLKHNKMYENKKISRAKLFTDWIEGICFISPLGEDLTPFTRCKLWYTQERDIIETLFNMFYINGLDYFMELISMVNLN